VNNCSLIRHWVDPGRVEGIFDPLSCNKLKTAGIYSISDITEFKAGVVSLLSHNLILSKGYQISNKLYLSIVNTVTMSDNMSIQAKFLPKDNANPFQSPLPRINLNDNQIQEI
jgi:hypothetical protein